ncbi:Vms1/Ankzf1 family peptidyl-tRNA hydrolase [Halobacteria archaeon AArc-m2/3/4]|uniref:Vms1/Ankzf1 family peptidyl-tRNA hydrolase n=1 Tax=Natronoglomus mannanivorans TaxID=2979990 RepID=A0ABT2QC61_9EURY|nr:Vms1/Ankzf1 family peptidyl-tRNA hydrolase [Halobacteria archaeon AArc-m2/3/4]
MIDRLLGRASLKARIDELEDENERLQKRFEAESERRSDAVTARQEAEERQNRLEDRIAQLEGELERLDDDDGLDLEYRRQERLRGERLEAVLDRLSSFRTGPEGALTATVGIGAGGGERVRNRNGNGNGDRESEEEKEGPHGVPEPVADALGDRAALAGDAAPCLVCVDDASLVSVALEGPLVPALDPMWSDRFDLEAEWFQPSGTYALALVRADLFAIGVYEGRDRVDYRGFESDVKGSHSKGGFSQARFERIRDGQIDDHLERCREAIADVRRDVDADRLYLVGQRGAVDAVAEEVDADATAAVDATGDPKPALEDAHHSFFTVDLSVL